MTFAAGLRRRGACDVAFLHFYWPVEEYQRLGLRGPRDPLAPDPEVVKDLEPKLRARVGALPQASAASRTCLLCPGPRRSATRPRKARSVVDLARKRLAELGRPAGVGDDAAFAKLSETIVEEIPFRAETRTSGVKTTSGITILKGAIDAIEKKVGSLPEAWSGRGRSDRRSRRHAAHPRERGPRPWRHRAQGHGQGGARRALRRVPADGHQDGDDHWRQRADGRDIAKEAGVDDFIAQATPEEKIAFIRAQQAEGHWSR